MITMSKGINRKRKYEDSGRIVCSSGNDESALDRRALSLTDGDLGSKPSALDVSVHYSLRSGVRRIPVLVPNRFERQIFMSQSRERYSDAEDVDSLSFSDGKSESADSEHFRDDDASSNGVGYDETQRRTVRPLMPDFTDEDEIPYLTLPASSVDLMIDAESSLQAVGIYQVLRQFSRILRLSPFRFEDFCAALTVNEQSCLLVDTHIALLKCILQEEDSSNATFGPNDARDSINICFFVIDALTWFEAVRMYLESLTNRNEIQQVMSLFTGRHYQNLNTSQRLLLLQTLLDLFLSTSFVREAIMKEGDFIHEEQCRLCHRRGDLICCETCPAVFHLECLNPPLTAVPDEDWFCGICSALQVKGINECSSGMKNSSLLCRLEPLGYDRHHRKYWLLCRRIFVEGDDNSIWYYSSKTQLQELMLSLDGDKWEVELVLALKDLKNVIVEQMDITEELTNKARGKRKSALASCDGLRLKLESSQTLLDGISREITGDKGDPISSMELNEINEKIISDKTDVRTSEENEENEGENMLLSQELLSTTRPLCPKGNKENLASYICEKLNNGLSTESATVIRQTRSLSKNLTDSSEFETEIPHQSCRPFPLLFKLGMEGNYKTYVNLYSTNPLALSKQQQSDEREKRRHLSYKFSLTLVSEFSWSGAVYGLTKQIVEAIRKSLILLETSIDKCFLHPNWSQNCGSWQKAVSLCSTAADFGLVLMTFEACMKPVLFNSVWHESLGHIKLRRVTASEREERKKRQKEFKRLRQEDDNFSGTFVKYSLGVHHQVWRQKGEEYRSTGRGGWFWVSATRVTNPCHTAKCNLQQVFKSNCQSSNSNILAKDGRKESVGCNFPEVTGVEEPCNSNLGGYQSEEKYNKQELDDNNLEVAFCKEPGEIIQDAKGKFSDFFDDSDALLSFYRQKPTIPCLLDGLLEKRKKHIEMELKQKDALEQALRKFQASVALTEFVKPNHVLKEVKNDGELRSPGHESSSLSLNNTFVAKLNFARQELSCCESNNVKEEFNKDDSDDEVALDKEDLEDSSSIESAAVQGKMEDITLSEDSNASYASSANLIPPPIRSISLGRQHLKQSPRILLTVKEFPNDSISYQAVSDGKADNMDAIDDKSKIVLNCSQNVIHSLQKYIKNENIILTLDSIKEIEDKLKEIGQTQYKVRLFKHTITGENKQKQIKKRNVPRAQNFYTECNRRSLFVTEKDELAKMARKWGQIEAVGFNYSCKLHDVGWPYPFPRPYFKTAWRCRTQMAKNISAIALQLRILWASIRWDDLAMKYPAGKNSTTVTDTNITTVELLRRRDIGPTNLRAEYLIQKTVSPLDIPNTSKERSLPPQRSGLRERRQQDTSVFREPVISELWVPEEHLELWEIRLFSERVEKRQHKLREKTSEKKTKAVAPSVKSQELVCQILKANLQKNSDKKPTEQISVDVGSAAVEEELQKQRLLMQQKRLGLLLWRGQMSETKGILLNTKASSMDTASVSSSSSLNSGPRSLKMAFRQQRSSKTSAREMAFPVPIVSTSVPIVQPTFSSATSTREKLTAAQAAVSLPLLSSVSPSINSSPSAVQSIRIKKGPDGQLLITGLQPGQEIIRLSDGRLQLVTKSLPPATSGMPEQPLVMHQDSFFSNQQTSVVRDPVISEVHGILLQDSQNRLTLEGVRNDQCKANELPLTAEQQTKVTVATAVEKLFACLSPHRLQVKRLSSEMPLCDRQNSDVIVENHSKDYSVETCSSVSKTEVVLSNASTDNVSSLPSVQNSSVLTDFADSLPNLISNNLNAANELGKNGIAKFQHLVSAESISNSSHFSNFSNPVDSLCLSYRQLPVSTLADCAGNCLDLQQPSSSSSAHISEVVETKMFTGGKEVHSITPAGNGNSTASSTLVSDFVSSRLPVIKGSCKRKKEAKWEEGELAGSSKMKGYMEKSPNIQGRIDELSFQNVSLKEKISTFPSFLGRFKQKFTDTSEEPSEPSQLNQHKSQEAVMQEFNESNSNRDEISPQLSSSELVKKHAFCKNIAASGRKDNRMDEKQKLFCVCRTPYDPNRLYIGCDICLSWFHASCVNLSEEKVLVIGSYVCAVCQSKQLNREELFCICRQPYDRSQFYIGCDECGNWFHGNCVGVAPSDVQQMECYVCRMCFLKKDCDKMSLQECHWSSLRKFISALKANSMALPFGKGVSQSKNPAYSAVVRETLDLSAVEQKVKNHCYMQLKDFLTDMLNIFNTCYIYNQRSSDIFHNAMIVENEFLNRFEKLKTSFSPIAS